MRKLVGSILTAGVLLLPSCILAADSSRTSLLDRPIETLKKQIAATAHCTWGPGVGMNIIGIPRRQTCSGPFKENWHSIQLETTADGQLESISFLPKLGELYGDANNNTHVRLLEREKMATAETVAKLFPTWHDGRAWLDAALSQAIENYFQTSIRIDNTSIYVREWEYVNLDHPFALVVLTKKTDLTEYKKYPCADDEQGPPDLDCSSRDPSEKRSPDNPVLHPK